MTAQRSPKKIAVKKKGATKAMANPTPTSRVAKSATAKERTPKSGTKRRPLAPITAEDEGVALTLDRYQVLASDTDIEGPDNLLVPLLGLSGEIGNLVAEYKKKIRDDDTVYVGFEEVLQTEIGDILWYLAALARRKDYTLSDIAHANITKTRRRWIAPGAPPDVPFDEGFPPKERLPRRFEAVFTTFTSEKGIETCNLRLQGDDFGDPIDDNARHEDNYRFHDIFHIAHAAVLGWSPVLRALLKRKRKEFKPEFDRVEDGARAIATEEAITALVFELAKEWNYFAGATAVDDSILTTVQAIANRLEGGSLPGAQWEEAILSGYRVWRDLRDNNGGRVVVNLDKASLKYAGLRRSDLR